MSKFLFLGTALFLSAVCSYAQKKQVDTLQEIVVTANKTNQPLGATAKDMTILTKEQLNSAKGKTVAQVLNEQAGIIVNGALNNIGSVQTIYMRGANAGRVLLLIDGIPMYDASSITTDYDLNFLALSEVEKIEISKGAQSSLYGSDAIAGVINIITHRNEAKKSSGLRVSSAFGSKNTSRNNLHFYGVLPKLDYALKFAQLKTDGFSSAYDSSGKNNFAPNGYQGSVMSASINWKGFKNIQIRPYIQYSDYKTSLDAGPFKDSKVYFAKNNVLNTGFFANYLYKKWQFQANYQYSLTKRYYDNGYTNGDSVYSTINYYGVAQFAALQSSFKPNDNVFWNMGVEYNYQNANGLYISSSYGSFLQMDSMLSAASIYTNLSLQFFKKKLIVELADRFHTHSKYGSHNTYAINAAVVLSNTFRIIGAVSTGYKSPSLYQLYNPDAGNQELKPEISYNQEAGLSWQQKFGQLKAVYFFRNIKNGIDYDYVAYKYFNYAQQKVNGLELTATVFLLKTLQLNGNFTYLNGQETTQNRVDNQAIITYNYLLRRPKSAVNARLQWQALPSWQVGLSYQFSSKRYDIGGYLQPDVALKSYSIFGLNTNYQWKKNISFFGNIQNLFNSSFFVNYGYTAIPFIINGGIQVDL